MTTFAENFSRLLGMHDLTDRQAAQLLRLAPQTISMWRRTDREPSANTLHAIANFFEINSLDLGARPFQEMLPMLADPERFQRVEKKIRRGELTAV